PNVEPVNLAVVGNVVVLTADGIVTATYVELLLAAKSVKSFCCKLRVVAISWSHGHPAGFVSCYVFKSSEEFQSLVLNERVDLYRFHFFESRVETSSCVVVGSHKVVLGKQGVVVS